MGEAKFTPGPWQSQHQWDADGIYSIIGGIDGPDDGRFHYTHVCEVNEECRDAYANVALIAAAPDLYEALQRIVLMHANFSTAPEWKKARAALAKACPTPAQAATDDVGGGQ